MNFSYLSNLQIAFSGKPASGACHSWSEHELLLFFVRVVEELHCLLTVCSQLNQKQLSERFYMGRGYTSNIADSKYINRGPMYVLINNNNVQNIDNCPVYLQRSYCGT